MDDNPYRSPETRAERPPAYYAKLLDGFLIAATVATIVAVLIFCLWTTFG